jgi:hypothetical protein
MCDQWWRRQLVSESRGECAGVAIDSNQCLIRVAVHKPKDSPGRRVPARVVSAPPG